MNLLEADIAILGGGCVGATIYHELVAMGFTNVVLVDAGRLELSATAHSGGMLRVFHEGLEHTELALGHYQHLLQRNAILGQVESLSKTGSLYFARKHRFDDFQESLRTMEASGYPFQILTEPQGRRAFPQFDWPGETWAVYEPEGASLNPILFSNVLINEANNSGGVFVENFDVKRISAYSGGYRLSAEQGAVTTQVLILAGGARMLSRLSDLGLQLALEVRGLKVQVFDRKPGSPRLPNFFNRETLCYGMLGEPDKVILSEKAAAHFRAEVTSGQPEIREAHDCYAPRRKGYLGQVPGHVGLLIASGWGGTAFKFSLEIAKRIGRIVERDVYERGVRRVS